MKCPTCMHTIWREDGKCRPCTLSEGHDAVESHRLHPDHRVGDLTNVDWSRMLNRRIDAPSMGTLTRDDLTDLRTQIESHRFPDPILYVHDSIIMEVPVVEGAADAMRLGGEAVAAMGAPFPLTGREFRHHVHNDPVPGIDLEFTGRAQGALCPSCERANCMVGRAERQRVARIRRSARTVMFGGFGGPMFGSARSGKSHMMLEALRNLPDATVISFDMESTNWRERFMPHEISMVATPADAGRLRGMTNSMVMYDDFQVFDSMPPATPKRTPRHPKHPPSPVPPHITKGLADAVNALPRSHK